MESISFLVNKRDRIGLTGRNGAGKSTLLKILAGVQEPSEGSVSMSSDLKIGYLPQTKVYAEGKTVRKEAESAFDDVLALREEIERLHLGGVSQKAKPAASAGISCLPGGFDPGERIDR